MHELQCPMCGTRFTDTCTNASCEINRRIADDMKHSANYNLIKLEKMALEKVYKSARAYAAGRAAGKPTNAADYCNDCHSYYDGSKCNCKSDLKLYEVTVHVKWPSPGTPADTYREVLVVLLATDSGEAMQHAEKSQGVTEVGDRAKSKWTELRGPFKNGRILSARNK